MLRRGNRHSSNERLGECKVLWNCRFICLGAIMGKYNLRQKDKEISGWLSLFEAFRKVWIGRGWGHG